MKSFFFFFLLGDRLKADVEVFDARRSNLGNYMYVHVHVHTAQDGTIHILDRRIQKQNA